MFVQLKELQDGLLIKVEEIIHVVCYNFHTKMEEWLLYENLGVCIYFFPIFLKAIQVKKGDFTTL